MDYGRQTPKIIYLSTAMHKLTNFIEPNDTLQYTVWLFVSEKKSINIVLVSSVISVSLWCENNLSINTNKSILYFQLKIWFLCKQWKYSYVVIINALFPQIDVISTFSILNSISLLLSFDFCFVQCKYGELDRMYACCVITNSYDND